MTGSCVCGGVRFEVRRAVGPFELCHCDDAPGLRPERHIFVEHRAGWHAITDALPQLDRAALVRLRTR